METSAPPSTWTKLGLIPANILASEKTHTTEVKTTKKYNTISVKAEILGNNLNCKSVTHLNQTCTYLVLGLLFSKEKSTKRLQIKSNLQLKILILRAPIFQVLLSRVALVLYWMRSPVTISSTSCCSPHGSTFFCFAKIIWICYPPSETYIDPEKRFSQKESSLSSAIFQGLC